ncbi:Gfo/Idh/MocA family protein [Microcella alkaliphila]|uniref:Oxidoreductase domain-containing protein n=1 Tax=Microcella alkaliphila TaxID=279828 RepID=A0A0U5BRT6_9MICO|nr:Gfo/Idh/MocA family oxidoreductase [Microcella alkaliphila]BAU31053.1 oxidoreductase domain-containing protein [Microcella alkaliphila]
MSRGLRWGLIGTSDIAQTRVIGAIRACGGAVEIVHSSSADRAATYAHANGIPAGTSDLPALLAAEIDAVYISTTNDLHHPQSMAALAAGKHVLCEKPLAITIRDAREMIETAAERGLVLAANHHLPGSPLHAAARDLVRSGRIGTVLSARVHHAVLLPERLRGWRVESAAPGSGVIADITCHDASVLNPLLGRPRRVAALSAHQGQWNAGAEDAVMTVIEYEGSAGERILAQTHDAFTVEFDRTSLTIHGTLGSIHISDAMTQDTHGTVTLTTATGVELIPVDTSRDLYEIIIDAFTAAIAGHGQPTASGEDGLAALRVALAAQESARTGRMVGMD